MCQTVASHASSHQYDSKYNLQRPHSGAVRLILRQLLINLVFRIMPLQGDPQNCLPLLFIWQHDLHTGMQPKSVVLLDWALSRTTSCCKATTL